MRKRFIAKPTINCFQFARQIKIYIKVNSDILDRKYEYQAYWPVVVAYLY